MTLSRRDYLAQVGSVAAGVLPVERPNLVLYNANVITAEPRQPRAQGIAIWGDCIYAVTIPAERTMVGGRWVYES